MQNKGAFYSSMGNVFESSVSYSHEATIKSCYVPIIRVQNLHLTLTFHLASAEYSVNSSKFRKMFLSIYLVIWMMLYIPQSNRNCQVFFSFIVIQLCLCKPELLALIGENDLLLFSHFHIAQVAEDVISLHIRNTVFKTFTLKVEIDLGLTPCHKENTAYEI